MRGFSFFIITFLLLSFKLKNSGSGENLAINKFSDPAIREINDFKNDRKTFQLLPYLYDNKASYREEAALAFASLQDTVAIHYLVPLLKDPDVSVRNATAFAIGQIGKNTVEGDLLNAFYAESSPAVKASLLTAMGKCANQRVLISFNMLSPKDTVISAGLAWGIYFAGLKDQVYEPLTKKAIKLLSSSNSPETRLAIAHFLSRTKSLDIIPLEKDIIQALNTERKAEVKMALLLALGRSTGKEAETILCQHAFSDPDYRVRVNAMRALSEMGQSPLHKDVFKSVYDANVNSAVAAAELILKKATVKELSEIQNHIDKVSNWRVSAILRTAAVKVANGDPSQEDKAWGKYQKSKNVYEKGYLLKAIAQNPASYKNISKEVYASKDPVIKSYGIEALAEASKMLENNPQLKQPYFEIFKKAFETGDVALMGTASYVFRDPELGFDKMIDNYTFLFQARDRLKMPEEVETYQEIQKTIDYLAKSSSVHKPAALPYTPIDWNVVTNIPLNKQVLVKTSKGDFRMELLVEEAPSTVAKFVSLIEKRFYNGKNFHRVVPNFVIQGGDPRGDGWGTADFILRSEFSNKSFREGYIGMASAGKDTESCQWFVMHSPAPHLDGRYTNFARIVSGMKVIHSIEPGDIIKSVELID